MLSWLWPFGRKETPAACPAPASPKAPEPTPGPAAKIRKVRRKQGEARK